MMVGVGTAVHALYIGNPQNRGRQDFFTMPNAGFEPGTSGMTIQHFTAAPNANLPNGRYSCLFKSRATHQFIIFKLRWDIR